MKLILAVLGTCLSLGGVSCQDRVNNAIRDLSARRVERREQAERELRKLGEKAVPALRKAILDKDLEVSSRARTVLSTILGEIAFRKVHQNLMSSGNIRVAFEMERMTPGGKRQVTDRFHGELTLKGCDRVQFTADSIQNERKVRVEVLSDGEMTQNRFEDGEGSKEEAPSRFAEKWKSVITKTGILIPAFIPGMELFDRTDFIDLIKVSCLKGTTLDTGESVIDYTVEFPSTVSGLEARIMQVRLWYDPKTYLILKRFSRLKVGEELRNTFQETYSGWALNGKPQDKKSSTKEH